MVRSKQGGGRIRDGAGVMRSKGGGRSGEK